MAGTKARSSKKSKQSAVEPGNAKLTHIGRATSQIVRDAAAVLDEELAVGIIAAKKMQERFQKERRVVPSDFNDALQRFQGDAHSLINLLNEQVAEISSKENTELISQLIRHSHDVLNLVVGMINIGAELTNELLETKPSRTRANTNRRAR